MFKKVLSGFSKFFTRDKIILIVVFFVLGYALLSYSSVKNTVFDRMENGDGSIVPKMPSTETPPISPPIAPPQPSSNNYLAKSVENPKDLLPKDSNGQWTALNPVTVGQNGVMPDLLQAGYHIGLDTIGQSLRNANMQLRSDPYIPKVDLGPWMQSTIEPDLGRVPLELGNGSK